MPRSLRLPQTLPAGLALVAAASVMLLSGCTADTPEPSGTAAPPSASASSDPSAAPSGAPTEPAEEPTPFAIGCDELVTTQQMYDFNPNFGNDPNYSPSGPGVVAVAEEQGTACGWLNQTSGDVIEIGVAKLPPGALEQRKNDAALTSHPVPTYGTPPELDGYFTQSGNRGEAQVFRGPYWIVIDSEALFEPGDAQQLVSAVLANLPAA
jgi:hypothetical protein